MSFLSVIKSIGHVLGIITKDVAPFDNLISAIPVFGPIAATVIGAIAAIEQQTTGTGQGATKKSAATDIITALLPHLDAAMLSAVIDDVVAGLNTIEAAVSKLPPAPAAPATS